MLTCLGVVENRFLFKEFNVIERVIGYANNRVTEVLVIAFFTCEFLRRVFIDEFVF